MLKLWRIYINRGNRLFDETEDPAIGRKGRFMRRKRACKSQADIPVLYEAGLLMIGFEGKLHGG